MTDLAQPLGAVPRHAAACVDREHEVERDLIEPRVVDPLSHAVVDDLEVTGREVRNGAPVARHENVHANGLDGRPERRRLALGGGQARQRDHQRSRSHRGTFAATHAQTAAS